MILRKTTRICIQRIEWFTQEAQAPSDDSAIATTPRPAGTLVAAVTPATGARVVRSDDPAELAESDTEVKRSAACPVGPVGRWGSGAPVRAAAWVAGRPGFIAGPVGPMPRHVVAAHPSVGVDRAVAVAAV